MQDPVRRPGNSDRYCRPVSSPPRNVRLLIDASDSDAVSAVLDGDIATLPIPHRHPARQTGGQIMGPVLEYVLPAVASLGVAVRIVLAVVRGLAVGAVIDNTGDEISVTRNRSLPRGTLVVRHDGQTVEVIDLAGQTNIAERLTGLLDKRQD
jgi:hypothetical protein